MGLVSRKPVVIVFDCFYLGMWSHANNKCTDQIVQPCIYNCLESIIVNLALCQNSTF